MRLPNDYRTTPANGRTPGFTIIELLVVIAIVGIILGLLMVALSGARQTSRRAQCRSQLRQLGLALDQYIELNGGAAGVLPWAAKLPSVTPERPSMVKLLGPWIENNLAVYECPDDRYYFDREGLSYEYRAEFLEGRTRIQARRRRGRDEDLLPSSEVLVMYDFEPIHGELGTPAARNALFLDWHVEGL
ncbi:MAG: DUF1559 domain-containing protein [Pirellulales bacterium]|nr:DUF1559 domain-containing protein [Pirellulales bacterium]